ncbi:MAG TPA: MGMT family protein [Candidatus Saccharimonadales bacterium]|nr:MGMT family protein [Candidatus Saccharimonadales bacterium]
MQGKADKQFRDMVEAVVAQIPQGRVMTYGQIAALCGSPRSARIVGGIAHFGNPELPWQRVVMKDGSLARGFPGGLTGHKSALEADGVNIADDYRIDVEEYIWRPDL